MRRATLWIVTLVCLVISLQAHSLEHLQVNTGFDEPVLSVYRAILKEVGKDTGVDIDVEFVSAERSLQLVAAGVDDAECCRVKSIVEKEYPGLVAVEPSFITMRFVAFTKQADIHIKSWDDLLPYSVATVSGWKIHVNNLGRIKHNNALVLDSPYSLFKMLDDERIDVALLGDMNGMYELKRLGITDYKMQSPALAEVPLYLFLHQNKAYLAPRLRESLEKIKVSGQLDTVIKRALESAL